MYSAALTALTAALQRLDAPALALTLVAAVAAALLVARACKQSAAPRSASVQGGYRRASKRTSNVAGSTTASQQTSDSAPQDAPWEVCLITGAASGIGREAALQAAAAAGSCRSLTLALWDVDAARLAAVIAEVRSIAPHVQVVPCVVDLADAEATASAAAALQAALPPGRHVSTVISNAGIVLGKHVEELTSDDVQRALGVNLVASFTLLRAFLPGMKKAAAAATTFRATLGARTKAGSWVFVGSFMSYAAGARLTEYCAGKWGLRGMAEALRLELRREGLHDAIPVSMLCPYVVDTGMFNGAFEGAWNPVRDALFPPLPAAAVAREALVAAHLWDGQGDSAWCRWLCPPTRWLGNNYGSLDIVLPRVLLWVSLLTRLALPGWVYEASLAAFGACTGMDTYKPLPDRAATLVLPLPGGKTSRSASATVALSEAAIVAGGSGGSSGSRRGSSRGPVAARARKM